MLPLIDSSVRTHNELYALTMDDESDSESWQQQLKQCAKHADLISQAVAHTHGKLAEKLTGYCHCPSRRQRGLVHAGHQRGRQRGRDVGASCHPVPCAASQRCGLFLMEEAGQKATRV